MLNVLLLERFRILIWIGSRCLLLSFSLWVWLDGLRVVVILRLLFGIQRLLEIVWLFVITLVEVWVAQSFRFEILEGVLGFVVDDLLFMFSSVFLALWLLILVLICLI